MAEENTSSNVVSKLDSLYEFDREPISEAKLHSGRYFAGLYAGEHVAATEFVIGALFVSWGAGAADIIFGLILGNLLAVFSWTFVAAPIAVKTRLTLYWYLRKIAGPYVTVVYNILNAILYCILAGAMITVSASAVRLPFKIPPQTQWYPEDLRFVVVVIIVGAVVVTLAILGFKRLSQFSTLCSPWMFLMFIAGGLACLPALAAQVPEIGSIKGLDDLWYLAKNTIWTGTALGGGTSLGFWHVAAFAWICNLAMHLGLSDMAIFRYAKKASYGLYSAFGMFLGHYLAWIAAGIMGATTALIMTTALPNLDSGEIAFFALGTTGAIAVVIAGWTTSNPTLYRAGLALQVITPGWPRWVVTLVAGTITTIIACFPFVFTKLLDFVAFYGLLLAPIGAIVIIEHYVFPIIGYTRYWTSIQNKLLNWPALLSWFIAIFIAYLLWTNEILHLFFLFLPIWILTSVLYMILAPLAGARKKSSEPEEDDSNYTDKTRTDEDESDQAPKDLSWMAKIAGIIAIVALVFCFIIPLTVYIMGNENYPENMAFMKNALVWLMLIYFISGMYYMRSENNQ
jgi:NCS1 family nucleobase:cation symporter-1